MLKIISIPAFKDNYIWLIINSQLGQAVAVDPGDASPVLSFLESNNLSLAGILVTHKHADHTGGIGALIDRFPYIAVYAHPIEKIPLMTHPVKHDEIVMIDKWPVTYKVIHIPGHTMGHVAFYDHQALFSGDTLFGAGCGRIFEGTAEEMFCSLNKLMMLPDETMIYCGHEYTLANLNFASHVEPDNEDIRQRIKLTEKMILNNNSSLPSTMSSERKTNPFLRCTQKSVIERVQIYANRKLTNSVEVLRELREWKNNF
jgi:hydroxyacylglutathione hydrolase